MCDVNSCQNSIVNEASMLSESDILFKLKNLYIIEQSIEDEMAMLNTQKYVVQTKISDLLGLNKINREPKKYKCVTPSNISNELCDFIGVERGTLMARTDITRIINKYIITNNLRDPTDRSKIYPDDKLRQLLQIPEHEQLTFFNIQKYIGQHFVNY